MFININACIEAQCKTCYSTVYISNMNINLSFIFTPRDNCYESAMNGWLLGNYSSAIHAHKSRDSFPTSSVNSAAKPSSHERLIHAIAFDLLIKEFRLFSTQTTERVTPACHSHAILNIVQMELCS